MAKFIVALSSILWFAFATGLENKTTYDFGETATITCNHPDIDTCSWTKIEGYNHPSLCLSSPDQETCIIRSSSNDTQMYEWTTTQCTLSFTTLDIYHDGTYKCDLTLFNDRSYTQKYVVNVVKTPNLEFESHFAFDGPVKVPLQRPQKVICSYSGGFPRAELSAGIVEANGMWVRKLDTFNTNNAIENTDDKTWSERNWRCSIERFHFH